MADTRNLALFLFFFLLYKSFNLSQIFINDIFTSLIMKTKTTKMLSLKIPDSFLSLVHASYVYETIKFAVLVVIGWPTPASNKRVMIVIFKVNFLYAPITECIRLRSSLTDLFGYLNSIFVIKFDFRDGLFAERALFLTVALIKPVF